MLKRIIFLHVIPIIIALTLVLLIFPLVRNHFNPKNTTKIIKGKQTKISAVMSDLVNSPNDELEYVASIKNKNQLTLFGSSEFTDSPIIPYHFFPDSLGIPTIGIGHAYHQELSILIELLATHQYNKGSKVCIFLSPGWFEADGTNIQAFIEFARPNFLKRIDNNKNIDLKYKKHIGEFIQSQKDNIEGITKEMNTFITYSNTNNTSLFDKINNFIKSYFESINSSEKIEYQITQNNNLTPRKWNGNYDETAYQIQTQFINSITTNKMYVYDEYYTKYVVDENGNERNGTLEAIDFTTNNEYADFKLLVEYIKEQNINASFVMIPFNPYFYKNASIYKPLIDSITETLSNKKIPFYNLYVYDTTSYEPGTLKDIMHLGDYGWMKVNKFLYNLYFKDEK